MTVDELFESKEYMDLRMTFENRIVLQDVVDHLDMLAEEILDSYMEEVVPKMNEIHTDQFKGEFLKMKLISEAREILVDDLYQLICRLVLIDGCFENVTKEKINYEEFKKAISKQR